MRLSLLSVEDEEYSYITAFMVIGFLLFGSGGFLVYRKLFELSVAVDKLPHLHMGMCRTVSVQSHPLQEQNHALDDLAKKLAAASEPVREVTSSLEKLSSRLGGNCPLFGCLGETVERPKAVKMKL